MTIEEWLDAIDARRKAITQPPWRIGTPSPNGMQNVGTLKGLLVAPTFEVHDAQLIAAAPTDIDRLSRALRVAVEALDFYAGRVYAMEYGFAPKVVMDGGKSARDALRQISKIGGEGE